MQSYAERGELVTAEPGCTMIAQQLLPVMARLFLAI